MRLSFLLFPDLVNPIPVSLKFKVAGLVHIDLNCTAEPSESDHDPTHLLARFSYRAIENILHEVEGVLLGATIGLRQFQGLLKEPVITLQAVTCHMWWEALAEPLLNSFLIGIRIAQFELF